MDSWWFAKFLLVFKSDSTQWVVGAGMALSQAATERNLLVVLTVIRPGKCPALLSINQRVTPATQHWTQPDIVGANAIQNSRDKVKKKHV